MPGKPMISLPIHCAPCGIARCRVVAAALLLGMALAPTAASAQAVAPAPAGNAEVHAVDYAPIPSGASFETQANDDSELNQEALGKFNAGLTGRGYAVQSGSALVMVVETDLVRGQKQDNPLGQASVNNKEARVQANLFSTTQNSLLNPKRPIGPADRLYRISVSVYDRANGLYVWRGSVTRSDPGLDVAQATDEMIAGLIGAVGKTVNPVPAAAAP